tara:strand:- start:3317 stop:3652 length:336 start_codon:yes stop_codon:yes gene_type:complete
MDKYTRQIMQVYATLLRAHFVLLDEITDNATKPAMMKTARRASQAICATVYHMIHDTGVKPDWRMIEWISDLAPTADDFDFGLMEDVRAMELQAFPSPVGGYTGFGLYPTN